VQGILASWRKSRWSLQRAQLKGKELKAVTLEGSSCPVEGEIAGGGHVGAFIVPGKGEKDRRRSRWSVHRAR